MLDVKKNLKQLKISLELGPVFLLWCEHHNRTYKQKRKYIQDIQGRQTFVLQNSSGNFETSFRISLGNNKLRLVDRKQNICFTKKFLKISWRQSNATKHLLS